MKVHALLLALCALLIGCREAAVRPTFGGSAGGYAVNRLLVESAGGSSASAVGTPMSRAHRGVTDPVLYVADCSYENGDITFSRSTDGGTTWDRTVVGQGGRGNSTWFVKFGELITVFNSTNGLRVIESYDEGLTWQPSRLLPLSGWAPQPDFYVSDGTIHQVWFDGGAVRYAVSDDQLLTWSSARIITDVYYYVSPLRISVHNDAIYVFMRRWGEDDTNGECSLFVSVDGGVTWTEHGLPGKRYPIGAAMAVSDGGVALVFGNEQGFIYSPDHGLSWSTLTPIDPTAGVWGVDMLAEEDRIVVSYLDANTATLRIATSIDGGATWIATTLVELGSLSSIQFNESTEIRGHDGKLYIRYPDSDGVPKVHVVG